MKQIDEASIQRLNEVIIYLKEKSKNKLMVRLYHKILFLIELEHFKSHQKLFIGLDFFSYKYGPFSIEIAEALDSPNEKILVTEIVKEKVDEILNQYELKDFKYETMEQCYNKIVDYIHSLYFYNITPFRESLDFSQYNFEDLFIVLGKPYLDGSQLEQDKKKSYEIRQRAKEYRCLFV